jgi:hypothetical protein
MKIIIRIIASLIVAHMASAAVAQTTSPASPASSAPAAAPISAASDGTRLRLQLSPYTRHNKFDEAHRTVIMAGLEREYPSGKLDGVALFRNSFGQPSIYIYPWGGVYPAIGGIQPLSFKWTAGLLYGYKEPYENKVPLNYKGFSPGAIFSLAYEFKPGWSGQINLLGTAALMLQLNVPLN